MAIWFARESSTNNTRNTASGAHDASASAGASVQGLTLVDL